MDRPPAFSYVTISSADAPRLVDFYRRLTGSDIGFQQGAYTVLDSGRQGAKLAFQAIAAGQPVVPVHVDVGVDDIDEVGRQIVAMGGRLGDKYDEVGSVWQQAFDPDGNVFCLIARQPESPPG